jgi:Sulfatase
VSPGGIITTVAGTGQNGFSGDDGPSGLAKINQARATTVAPNGALDDTLLILTSDHGEAFGEHGLYLHDASVYETHLHVPLWVHHPNEAPAAVADVVSTGDIFGLIRSAAGGGSGAGTILDQAYRHRRPIALAEHFHYPHTAGLLDRFRVNQAAAITRDRKVVVRGGLPEVYDLARDPGEAEPRSCLPGTAAIALRGEGLPREALTRATEHLFHRRPLRKAA